MSTEARRSSPGPWAGAVPNAFHLLIVSRAWEPLPHVSAVRATHMARELARRGIDVSVLTADCSPLLPAEPPSLDETLGRALAQPAPRVMAIDPRPAVPPEKAQRETAPRLPSPLRRLRTLARMIGWGPSADWARLAYRGALRLHAARPLDVVWAIRGDDSCHVVAWKLRRTLGIPWVADYKDPWNVFFSSSVACAVQRHVTARRLRTTHAVTETCAAQARADERRFAVQTHVVYSGFEPGAIAAAQPVRPGRGFCMAYIGTVDEASHDIGSVGRLFAALAARGAFERHPVALHHFGGPPGAFEPALREAGCQGRLHEHGVVAREHAFSLMRGSDLLLLLPLRYSGKGVGVKELEYFASGTPVLALGEPLPEIRALIAALPQVHVARDAQEAARVVEELARAAETTRRGPVNAPVLAEFTWTAQAARLHRILAAAAGAR